MRRYLLLTLSTIAVALAVAAPASAERVLTVDGATAPGPARYDCVRVIEQGPRSAENVLVLGPRGGARAAGEQQRMLTLVDRHTTYDQRAEPAPGNAVRSCSRRDCS